MRKKTFIKNEYKNNDNKIKQIPYFKTTNSQKISYIFEIKIKINNINNNKNSTTITTKSIFLLSYTRFDLNENLSGRYQLNKI